MKKVLLTSLVALFVAVPAFAEPPVYQEPTANKATEHANDGALTSGTYVKGAYNASIDYTTSVAEEALHDVTINNAEVTIPDSSIDVYNTWGSDTTTPTTVAGGTGTITNANISKTYVKTKTN